MAMIDYSGLKSFFFNCYRVNAAALENIRLPFYKGFALRGGLGYALHKIVCVKKKGVCQDCLIREQCPYSLIMGNPVTAGHPLARKFFTPHRPYIIIPPLDNTACYPKGSTFSFNLVLIGKLNTYLPHFIYAIAEMGKQGLGRQLGKFLLTSVDNLPLAGALEVIYEHKSNNLRLPDTPITFADFPVQETRCSRLKLRFITPLRLKSRNKLMSEIAFTQLISRLWERAQLLNHFFCCGPLQLDDKELLTQAGQVQTIENALKWYDLERFSNSQNAQLKMGGLVGAITYAGDFTALLPLLRLGEHIHAGKGASFGYGKYSIEY